MIIKKNDKKFRVNITKKPTGSNFNVFASVYCGKDLLFGSCFKENVDPKDIKNWASKRIDELSPLAESK